MTDSYLPAAPQIAPLYDNGPDISPIAWGMWRFEGTDVARARALVETAFEAGITLFDTADIYGLDGAAGFGGAEALLGRVFAEVPTLRERLVLASKGGIVPGVPYDSSPDICRARSMPRWDGSVSSISICGRCTARHANPPARTGAYAGEAGRVGVRSAQSACRTLRARKWRRCGRLSRYRLKHAAGVSPLHLAPLQDGQLDDAMAHGTRFWPGRH